MNQSLPHFVRDLQSSAPRRSEKLKSLNVRSGACLDAQNCFFRKQSERRLKVNRKLGDETSFAGA